MTVINHSGPKGQIILSDKPGLDNWINAYDAWYVLGSGLVGGMGAPEAIPFATKENAEKFVAKKGGKVYTFDTIEPSYIINSR